MATFGVGETAIILTALSAAAAVGSGVMAYSASQQQASAARDQGDYNAKVAENNAASARQQAAYEAQQTRMKGIRLAGAQKASYAKSGVELSGSAVDVMNDSAIQNELDALVQEKEGQALYNRYMDQGAAARVAGANSASSYQSQGAGSLLTGIVQGATTAYGGVRASPGTRPQALRAQEMRFA